MLASQVTRSKFFRTSQRISCYIATNNEIDTVPLIHRIWKRGRTCYLPVLMDGPRKCLWFAPCKPDTPYAINRFGIAEPVVHSRKLITARQLDLVLMPLVGFDMAGNRLGMGGGFYDRSLAFLHGRKIWHRPRLMGLAYEMQRIEKLTSDEWDIPLNAVATEQRLHVF